MQVSSYSSIRAGVLLTVVFVWILPYRSGAQNLVVNGDFEDHYATPIGSEILLEDFVKDWYSYFTTPDYAYIPPSVSVPVRPHSGNAMIGGYELGYFDNMKIYNREYIQGSLKAPLQAGTYYYAEAYVTPHVQPPVINWCIKNLGIAFTGRHYKRDTAAPRYLINVMPQVANEGGVLTNTAGWTKISGCFIAHGGESKVVLGNFETDSNTTGQYMRPPTEPELYGTAAYYFWDDISVVKVETAFSHDTTICNGASTLLSASVTDAAAYNWSNGATTPTIEVSQGGAYTVAVTTGQGCVIKQTIKVATDGCTGGCPDILLPNSFTPNNDGRNDYFRVINPDAIHFVDMSIYNRWGEQVYFTAHGAEGWDGTHKGQFCEVGMYGYMIRYKDCNTGETHMTKGEVTLIR